MKKILLPLLAFLTLLGNATFAQTANGKPMTSVYRRSSLHTMIMESENFPYKETVLNAYYNAPFPDKYNDHTIEGKSFNPLMYRRSASPSDSTADSVAFAKINDYRPIIDNYMMREKVAAQLVAKWFNRNEDGSFDMDLIGERGSYDASDMATRVASSSARGLASLSDAGEELIGNTFVVVSKLKFVSNEVTATAIRITAYIAADQIPNQYISMAARLAADVAYSKTHEGYTVWTTSYLYKLSWNDSIAAVFYNDLWMDKSRPDSIRAARFYSSDIFGMEFVGSEKSSSLVAFAGDRNASQVIEMATVRTIDNVYAKLQKKYDIFKTKTPLYTGYPITAKIGLKEAVEGGDRYEVLEQVQDANGKTKYVRKGIVKVDGKKIWDNRFVAGESAPAINDTETIALTDSLSVDAVVVEVKESKPVLDRTFFKGSKNYYPGMLIRQIK